MGRTRNLSPKRPRAAHHSSYWKPLGRSVSKLWAMVVSNHSYQRYQPRLTPTMYQDVSIINMFKLELHHWQYVNVRWYGYQDSNVAGSSRFGEWGYWPQRSLCGTWWAHHGELMGFCRTYRSVESVKLSSKAPGISWFVKSRFSANVSVYVYIYIYIRMFIYIHHKPQGKGSHKATLQPSCV